MQTYLDDGKIKQILKEALIEALEEKKMFFMSSLSKRLKTSV